jgi:hypothetical protein
MLIDRKDDDLLEVTPGLTDVTQGSDAPIEGPAIARIGEAFPGLAASFRRHNPLVSTIVRESAPTYVDDEYKTDWSSLRGTQYEPYIDRFVDVHNQRAEDALKRQIDNEIADKKIEDAMPWYERIPAQILAGTLDPTIALPGAVLVRGAKGGLSLLRTGLASGAATGAGVAAQETALQLSQETRELSESAFNIGGSLVLGGLLGAGAAKLLSAAEFIRFSKAIEDEIAGVSGPRVEPPTELDLLHGYPSASGFSGFKPLDQVPNEFRYDGGEGGVFGAYTYLDPTGRWIRGENGALGYDAAVRVKANFKKLFTLTPDNIAEFKRVVGDEAANSGVDAARVLQEKGYDGIRIKGFDKLEGDARYSLGVDGDMLMDQVVAFDPANTLTVVSKVDLPGRPSVGEPMDDYWRKVDDVINREVSSFSEPAPAAGSAPASTGAPASLSAAASVQNDFRIATPNILSKLLLNLTRKFAGVYRMGTNELASVREAGANLLRMGLHMAGPTVRHAVETAISVHRAFEAKALKAVDDQYKAARKAGVGVTREQFELALSAAARRSDAGDKVKDWLAKHSMPPELQPFVESAAAAGRKDVLERLLQEAIKVKIPGFDDTTAAKFAESYLTRMWNRQELIARPQEFITRAAGKFAYHAKRDFEAAVPAFLKKQGEIDAKIADAAGDSKKLVKLGEERATLEREFWDTWDVNKMGNKLDLSDPSAADFSDYGRLIAEESHKKLVGVTAEPSVRPELLKITSRGPMKDKTLPLQDIDFEDFLVNDYSEILRYYSRTMSTDIELTRRFGDPLGQKVLDDMAADWKARSDAETDPRKLARLKAAYDEGRNDFEKHIQLMRGMGKNGPYEGNFGRWARAFNQVNYIRISGGFVLSSFTDPVNVALRVGVMRYMSGLTDWAAGMERFQSEGFKMSKREAGFAIGLDKIIGNYHYNMMDLANPMARTEQKPIERMLAWASDKASKFNGMRAWADGNRMLAAAHTQNKILEFAERTSGRTAKQEQYLKFVNISEGDAKRIAARFAEHGETVDGYKVANTENWTKGLAGDELAQAENDVRVFRAAVNKDVTTSAIDAGVGDLPLWANSGTGRLMFQFQRFALASHQHILMRSTQEGYGKFAGTVVSLTMMGMFVALAKTYWDNRPELRSRYFRDPAHWVAEGLDFAGVLAIPMWVSNGVEKLSGDWTEGGKGFNPLKAPIRAFSTTRATESQRLQNRGVSGVIGGPTAGFIEDATRGGAAVKNFIEGDKVPKAQGNALQRVFPTSYIGVRQFFGYLYNPPEAR